MMQQRKTLISVALLAFICWIAQPSLVRGDDAAPGSGDNATTTDPEGGNVGSGEGNSGNEGTGGNGNDAEVEKKDTKYFGADLKTDYNAKYVSIMFGATLLSPFEFSEVTDEEMESSGDDDMGSGMDMSKRLKLDSGDVDAKFFLELGFRYRWAWLDRSSFVEAERLDEWLKMEGQKRSKLRDAVGAFRKKVEAYQDLAKSGGPGLDAAREQAAAALATVQATDGYSDLVAARDSARVEYTRERRAWRRWKMWNPYGQRRSGMRRFLYSLVPTGGQFRMGYVFDSETPTASTIAGASDLYIDIAPSWSLLSFSLPTGGPDQAPIRGSFNFEPTLSLVTDRETTDVHERILIGPSLVLGVPFEPVAAKENGTTDFGRSEVDALVSDNAKQDRIWEFVLRVGAVRVETPTFVSGKGREVNVRNDDPRFTDRWGFGVDMEVNVPISKTGGYLTARGSINSGFDPNPWAVQLGYTIPVGALYTQLLSLG